jgi:hypothetical protein
LRVRELIAQSTAGFRNDAGRNGEYRRVTARRAFRERQSLGKNAVVIRFATSRPISLEGEAMRSVLEGSDFRLEDMKDRRITVYLARPPIASPRMEDGCGS